MPFKVSNDIATNTYLYQSSALAEELLAAKPFEATDPDGDKVGDEDEYIRSIDGQVLKLSLALVPDDSSPEFNAELANAFLASDSIAQVSDNVGLKRSYVYQSKANAEALLATIPLTSRIVSESDYVRSAEGTMLKAVLILVNTTDEPEFSKERADDYLAELEAAKYNVIVSDKLGDYDYVHQTRLSAAEVTNDPTARFVDSESDPIVSLNHETYLRTSDGKLFKALVTFVEVDKEPEFDLEKAEAFLAEPPPTEA